VSAVSHWPSDAVDETLQVYLLGVVDFDDAVKLQERLVYELSGAATGGGILLLCEHPPGVSIGREGSAAQLKRSPLELERRGIPVRHVARGGDAIVHAPGQLAVYPLLPLQRLGLGLADYRERLEGAVVDVCRELRIGARRQEEAPGVWVRTGQAAALGAAVRSWVSLHGLYLNVAPAPEILQLVESPRFGRRASLQSVLQRPVSMNRVREALLRSLAARFGYTRQSVFAGHPWLVRTSRKVCVHV
jgi:lipoyl(octanoyl) transferase